MKLVIKSGRSRFELPVMDSVAPTCTVPNEGISVPLADLINMVSYAASASEVSQAFNYTGVVQLTGQTCAGTDGKRIAVFNSTGEGHKPILLPASCLGPLKTLDSETVQISEDQNNVYFSTPKAQFVARKLAKQFPLYDKIIPKQFKFKASIESDPMRAALRKVQPLMEENLKLCLTIDSKECILETSGEHGKAEDAVPVKQIYPTDDELLFGYKFLVRHDHILDFYEAAKGETFFACNADKEPIYFSCGEKSMLVSVGK